MDQDLINRNSKLRDRLIEQSKDAIGYDDYKQQLRAYQEILLEIIDIQKKQLESK